MTLEPVLLGLLVAPSIAGLLVALAALFAFLTRHPLKLALQDFFRRKRYPRTGICWGLATAYGCLAVVALAGGVVLARNPMLLLPIAIAAPLALVQFRADVANDSRSLGAELSGTAAMSAGAAMVAIAGGAGPALAGSLSLLIAARSVPAIVMVRTLLRRSRGTTTSLWPPVVLHLAAVTVAAACWNLGLTSLAALAAMLILLARAVWSLNRPVPPPKIIGWREIAYGVVTVALLALGARA